MSTFSDLPLELVELIIFHALRYKNSPAEISSIDLTYYFSEMEYHSDCGDWNNVKDSPTCHGNIKRSLSTLNALKLTCRIVRLAAIQVSLGWFDCQINDSLD